MATFIKAELLFHRADHRDRIIFGPRAGHGVRGLTRRYLGGGYFDDVLAKDPSTQSRPAPPLWRLLDDAGFAGIGLAAVEIRVRVLV